MSEDDDRVVWISWAMMMTFAMLAEELQALGFDRGQLVARLRREASQWTGPVAANLETMARFIEQPGLWEAATPERLRAQLAVVPGPPERDNE